MLITSIDNKKIKKYMSLKTSKGRYNENLFVVEGMHLCEEAFKADYLVDLLVLVGEEITFSYDREITYVTENVMKKVSNLVNTSKVIGICKMKENTTISGNHLLLLDDIQDPGNLGTIIRSSKAFDVDTIILSENSVDVYNDKVLRGTEGMFFHMNIVYCNLKEIIPSLKNEGFTVLGTNVKKGVDIKSVSSSKYALIMGNEGRGVHSDIASMCDKNIYIKMNKDCESLNVAVATSILLYELRGQNE